MTKLTWEEAVQLLRDHPKQHDLVKACYYDDPLLESAERFWNSLEWHAMKKYIPIPENGMQALDLGAGRGISSHALAKDGWLVTALEPNKSDLVGAGAINEIAKQTALPITVVSEYSEQLPFSNNVFDFVHCRQVLHHARDLPQTCREIFRVLKPGGMMISTREHVISKREDLQTFLDAHPLHCFYGGENAFLLDDYLAAIRSSGLNITQVLAPYDSVINYFPMTEEQCFEIYAKRIILLLGRRLGKYLLHRNKWLMKKLVAIANERDHMPGRLYSFVAMKNS